MPKFWDKPQTLGPSAGVVQQHYVAARTAELRRRNHALEEQCRTVLMGHPALAGVKMNGERWLQVFFKMQDSLKAADLTINFHADRWFSTENTYDSYTQAYERSGVLGNKPLLKHDDLNPADTRAAVDDAVTIPAAWNEAGPARRGLSPGTRAGHDIANRMRFGQQTFVDGGVVSENTLFNPKTKQVFAALNYGRREHGSSTTYGRSYMVLSPRFKVNALYYPGDTFFLKGENMSTLAQVPYWFLGGIVARARKALVDDILTSCYFDSRLPDMDPNKSLWQLLEGHIFSDVRFTGNITEIHLAAMRHSVVDKNAQKFAEKHGARLRYVSV